MRKGNTYRLPVPPTIKGTLDSAVEDIQTIHQYLSETNTIHNQAIVSFQTRLDTVQQIGAKQPPTVTGLTVIGKQGLFYLTWNRIKNVDGYVIVQATDSTMVQITNRYPVPDGDSCTFAVPVGNVAVTASFQVYAYQGPLYSDPSSAVSATTVAYGAGESAPPAAPKAPRAPKLAPIRSGPNLP